MKHSFNLILSGLFIVILLSCKGGKSGNNQEETNKTIPDTAKKMSVSTAVQGPGEQVYSKYCLACHQPDGNGMKGMFPPLAGNQKITGPFNELITIVLNGLQGPVTINGQEQNYNQVMPPQDYLTDQQIADVLTYVRSSWGNKASGVSSQEVEEIRKKGKE